MKPRDQRKRLVCRQFQSYDYATDSWTQVERYYDEFGELVYSVSMPIKEEETKASPYREGFDAFKDEQLKLGWEDLGKLCPHKPKTEDFIDWYRGWFSSARLSWYFQGKN